MLSSDWLAAIESGVEFPDGHFEPLFFEGDNLENPLPLFKSFAGGLRYCERLKDLTEDSILRGQYLIANPEVRLSEETMLPLVHEYLKMLEVVATEKNRLDKIKNLKAAKIRFEPDWGTFDAILNGGNDSSPSGLRDNLDDYYLSKIAKKDRRLYLADDVTLALTMSRDITMWVMDPLVETNLNLRAGYDIAIGGGLVAVLKDEIICHIQTL